MTNAITITTTTEAFCQHLWGASAVEVDPDDALGGLYPDPAGSEVVVGFGGEEIRGWPVRKMDGTEAVTLRPWFACNGVRNGFEVIADVWVTDRIGHIITGREGRKLSLLGGS